MGVGGVGGVGSRCEMIIRYSRVYGICFVSQERTQNSSAPGFNLLQVFVQDMLFQRLLVQQPPKRFFQFHGMANHLQNLQNMRKEPLR